MPPEPSSGEIVERPPEEKHEGKTVTSETVKQFAMLANNIEENNIPLNEEHVTEILSQRRLVLGYIHEDRKRDFEKVKLESSDNKYYYLIGVIVWLIVFGISIVHYKEQVITIITATAAFLGGYGFGSKTKKKD